MYSHDYHALNSVGDSYNCIHTFACMLTFCATSIIYYIIINLAYAFIKSTNMMYHNCVYKGDFYYINQMCQGHILIRMSLKCLKQIKFQIFIEISTNSCPIPLFFLLDKNFYKVIYFYNNTKNQSNFFYLYYELFRKNCISRPF